MEYNFAAKGILYYLIESVEAWRLFRTYAQWFKALFIMIQAKTATEQDV